MPKHTPRLPTFPEEMFQVSPTFLRSEIQQTSDKMKLALDSKRSKQASTASFPQFFRSGESLSWLTGWVAWSSSAGVPIKFRSHLLLTASGGRERGEATSMEVSSLFYTPLFLTSRTPERFSHGRTLFFPSTQNMIAKTQGMSAASKKKRYEKTKNIVMPWAALSGPLPMELPLGHVLGERAKDLLTKIPRPPPPLLAVLKSPHTREERNSPTSTVMNPILKKPPTIWRPFQGTPSTKQWQIPPPSANVASAAFFIHGRRKREEEVSWRRPHEGGGPKRGMCLPLLPPPLPPQMHTTKSCHSCPPQSGMELGEGRQRGNKTPGLGGGGRRHSGSISVPLAGDLGGVGGREWMKAPGLTQKKCSSR